MQQVTGRAASCVGLVLLSLLLVGCTTDPKASLSTASASQPGAGTATITLDGAEHTFDVKCARSASSTQASGSSGPYALTITMIGSPQAAVLVETMSGGSRIISQAINDLRDESGKAVGAISIKADGNRYTGTGTFVHTTIDASGKRVATTGSTVTSGTFVVNCGTGFQTPQPAPSSSKSS
ncbi:hypothetical protein SAMN05444157_0595 [Frankineae bacterium MT45]|nr:hypothetical protein SAMN05444157_0595 [Frankineae bacterium MT45]